MPIQLIVGLQNPGSNYQHTRHNAGAWLVEAFARHQHTNFSVQKKFYAELAETHMGAERLYLMLPGTFMNHSGKAVGEFAHFYRIPPQDILVVHDELDLPVGVCRLKQGGGHGGHNGLKDVQAKLGSADFLRLRVGIGHPGHKELVHGYVLSNPSPADRKNIDAAIDRAINILPRAIAGDIAQAMNELHR